MASVYFTSDWHLGHANLRWWRQKDFGIAAEDHDDYLFEQYLNTVKRKRDLVWFLGDMFVSKCDTQFQAYLERFRALPGEKRLILGNHDNDSLSGRRHVRDLLSVFDSVFGLVSYHKAWLSHAPVHPIELRGRANVHGHTHSNSIPDPRYISVCLEVNDFRPISWQANLRDRVQAVSRISRDAPGRSS